MFDLGVRLHVSSHCITLGMIMASFLTCVLDFLRVCASDEVCNPVPDARSFLLSVSCRSCHRLQQCLHSFPRLWLASSEGSVNSEEWVTVIYLALPVGSFTIWRRSTRRRWTTRDLKALANEDSRWQVLKAVVGWQGWGKGCTSILPPAGRVSAGEVPSEPGSRVGSAKAVRIDRPLVVEERHRSW